jgi:hypothetical protein
MRELGKLTDVLVLPPMPSEVRLPRTFLALVLLSAAAPFAGIVAAQEPSKPADGAQVQTAARARVPSPSSSQRAGAPAVTQGSQPLVVFEDGQLSITASNASLADVLFALRAATGADIDVPINASSERVTAQLGPGPARKILADLLGWSNFDYIIEGSDDDPLAVHSVTLMVRIKSGAPNASITVATPARPGINTPVKTEPEQVIAPEVSDAATAEVHTNQPVSSGDDSMPPANTQPRAGLPTANSMGTSASSGGSKSPSEMIQQLQQMYQQRRVMQEQQNQSGTQRPSQ